MADETTQTTTQPAEPSINDMRKMLGADQAPAAAPVPEAAPAAEAQAESQPATSTDDKPEAASATGEQPEGEEREPDPGAGESTEQDSKPEKKAGKFEPKTGDMPATVQKRINKAIWEKHESDRKAEQLAQENEELKKKLAEKDQAPGKPATGQAPDKPAQTASTFNEPEPDPDDEEKYPGGQYDPQFTKDLTSWQGRKDRADYQAAQAAEQQRVQAQERQAKLQEGWQQRVTKVQKTNPDMPEAVRHLEPLLVKSGQVDFIMESEVGPEIVLYLHQHPEETMKMAQTGNAMVIARELGKIEARLTQARSPEPPTKDPKPPKPLPDPIIPAGGHSAPVTAVDLNDPKLSMTAFKREASRQIRAARSY